MDQWLILHLKGQDLEKKTSLDEKVLQTLNSNELMEFFHISKIAWFQDENVKSATFLSSLSVSLFVIIIGIGIVTNIVIVIVNVIVIDIEFVIAVMLI